MENTSTTAESNESSSAFTGLMVLDIFLLFITTCLHTLGVYLMSKLKRPKNIHIILMHLSISEILIQISRSITAVYFFLYLDHTAFLGYQVSRTITIQGWCVSYVMIMIVVALDPLLIVVLKTKYADYMNKKNLRNLLACCWGIGVINTAINFAFSYEKREYIAAKYTFPTVTSMFIIFSVASYTMIYRSIKEKMNQIARRSVSKMTERPSMKFQVPVLIILTFFVFCLTPSISQVIIGEKNLTKLTLLGLGICFSTGFVFDALIYMLLHSMVKRLLLRFISKYRGNKNVVVDLTSRVRSHSPPKSGRRLEVKSRSNNGFDDTKF